jgi:hypothetical protein
VTTELLDKCKRSRMGWEPFLPAEPITEPQSMPAENLLENMCKRAAGARVPGRGTLPRYCWVLQS